MIEFITWTMVVLSLIGAVCCGAGFTCLMAVRWLKRSRG